MICWGCPCRPILELLNLGSAAIVTMKDSNSGLNLFWNSEGSNGNCKRRAGVMEVIETDWTDVLDSTNCVGKVRNEFIN